jgi:arylsulfatase A-like enzyme
MPRYPDFNERDVRDKPAWLRRLPTLPSSEIAALQDLRVRSAETLLAVDDALTRIIRALADTGRLHDTLFMFTSDNGLSSGEHRLTYKLNPYEESIRVPMVVRWDGHVPAGTASMKLAANVDLAPTFATAAGAVHPGVEGVSLIPLIVADMAVRGSFLIEHQHAYGEQDPPTYCAIRTPGWKLVRLATGERELYRLGTDPYELHNAAARFPAQRQRLMARLRELCFPRPPGMPAF